MRGDFYFDSIFSKIYNEYEKIGENSDEKG